MTIEDVRELQKQRDEIEAAVKVLESVSLPYGFNSDKSQLRFDGSICSLQLLVGDITAHIVENLTPELEDVLNA